MTGIYTWLTPPAPAAIAVVAVPVMPGLIDRAWPEPGRARFARLVNAAGTVVDEVLADRVDASTIWLMPHGGPGIRQAVTDCLEGHGLAPGAGTLDVTWRDLAAAAHPAAVTWLLAGETPPFPREFLFRQPVVLITGPANAGKSTLLNAWCGHGRALVSPQAGTTRDLVTATVLVHGWRLRLTDSAGLRATADPLEQAGQDLVAWARQRADVVLHLCPPEGGTVPLPGDLVVRGKADVPGAPLGAPSASSARDNQHVELEDPGAPASRLARENPPAGLEAGAPGSPQGAPSASSARDNQHVELEDPGAPAAWPARENARAGQAAGAPGAPNGAPGAPGAPNGAPGNLPWSHVGMPGRSPQDLLDDLGRAVLARLQLPPTSR